MTLALESGRPRSRTTDLTQRPLSWGRRLDLLCLAGLLGLILLYRLQFILPWITTLHVREALYVYLYFRALVFYRLRPTPILLLVGLFLAYSLLVGVHTYLLFGTEMAVKGFTRFVNVALLGPLVAIFVTTRRQFLLLVRIWLGIVFLAALSGLYQLLGGDLSWMTQGYVISRGATLRFMTLLGEPNVGGMASPIVLILAFYVVKRLFWRTMMVGLASVLILLSVSKAALAGCLLAVLLMFWLQNIHQGKLSLAVSKRTLRLLAGLVVAGAAALVIAALAYPQLLQQAQVYAQTLWIAVTGAGDRVEVSPSLLTDLTDRLVRMTVDGFRIAQSQSSFYGLNVLVGSSYGLAGTAAEELRGNSVVITAHNGFSEIFFVGGIVMLVLMVVLLAAVLWRLWRLSRHDALFRALLAAGIIYVAYMTTYPVMSNIGVGSFLWLTVGITANPSIAREAVRGGQRPPPASERT